MMPHRESAFDSPLPATLPDPAVAEFLEHRLALVRVNVSDEARLEQAREALRVIGRNSNEAIRRTDVQRPDDLFASVCFAARTHVGEARRLLAGPSADSSDLERARQRLYRGLCLVAEALAATSASRARRFERRPGHGVIFAAFVTQVVAAARSNRTDVAWVLEVADAELGIACAHPSFSRLSAEQRHMLRALRGELAAWSESDRTPDAGYALLNRLILLVDCLNH
jgi:hypothetical protein